MVEHDQQNTHSNSDPANRAEYVTNNKHHNMKLPFSVVETLFGRDLEQLVQGKCKSQWKSRHNVEAHTSRQVADS